MFKPSAHRFAALAAAAAAASAMALAGCDGADVEINGQKGVPLSEIEIAGPPPTEVFLASGDTVILTEGDTFAIKVEGTGTESLRFVRDKELIGITREEGWNGDSNATIRITMPAPTELVIGGAGTIKAPALASEADINIGGSGTVEFGKFTGQTLGINIGGSGTVTGAGTAKELEGMTGVRIAWQTDALYDMLRVQGTPAAEPEPGPLAESLITRLRDFIGT